MVTNSKCAQSIILNYVTTQRGMLLRMASKFLRDPDGAEDAVQMAALDALKPTARFDTSRPVSKWFNQVLYNRCLMIVRSRNRNREIIQSNMSQLDEDEFEQFVDSMVMVADEVFVAVSSDIFNFRGHNGQLVSITLAELFMGLSEHEINVFQDLQVDKEKKADVAAAYGISERDVQKLRTKVRSVAIANIGRAVEATKPKPPVVPTKYCRCCNSTKPQADFCRSSASNDGYRSNCKACQVRGMDRDKKRCRDRHYVTRKRNLMKIGKTILDTDIGYQTRIKIANK